MNERTGGTLLLAFICCGWPLIVHLGWIWISTGARRIDWSSIHLPWRKQ